MLWPLTCCFLPNEMARSNEAHIKFDAVSLEGGLLPAEWLSRVAALQAPHQSAADYGVPKGLHLRDEIARYWRIAEALWAELAVARTQTGHETLGATRRFAEQLLPQVFGFMDLSKGGEREVGDRRFPVSFEALGGRVPVIVGPHNEPLDHSVARHGDGIRRRSAWGVLQEYLNAADGVLWGLATNGLVLRLGRDNASFTRPAWLEVDLERVFAEKRFADFSVLWLLIHSSRFGRREQPVAECPLEAWRAAAREEGSRARARLRVGVERALLDLGQGFVAHPANTTLREALASGALSPQEYFNELLRLVYRAIFLLTVEERGILHVPTPSDPAARRAHDDAVSLYASGYGLRRLSERALRHSAHDRHLDLWESLRPVLAGLGRATGEPTLALPGLGGLFAPDQCRHLDAASLENRSLLGALFHLAWLREGDVLARVNWKDMGAEELGSVYESLLELVPRVDDGGRRFAFAGQEETGGNARKVSGSYYTPHALVQKLLDTTLDPVVSQRLAASPDNAERALLSISVLDPACGSGHFLLAAARRLAGHLARMRAGGTPSADEYRHALRDVVTHCIHGVDRNPMALELARMALWLETYTPDRALGFLDHHLVCGDSLLGLVGFSALEDGIPDEAFKALTGDDKEVTKTLTRLNRAGRKAFEKWQERGQLSLDLGTRPLADAFAQLDALADDGLVGVETKRLRYAELHEQAEASPLALAADCFVGAFLIPKQLAPGEHRLTDLQAAARFPTTASLMMALDRTLPTTHGAALAARGACREARVFHWPLAFPQVFVRGGFDLVLGNPPWVSFTGRQQAEIGERSLRLLLNRFPCVSRWPATHPAFAVLSVQLLANGGRAGLVLPKQVADLDAYAGAREEITTVARLASPVIDAGEEAFPGVTQPVGLFSLAAARGAVERSSASWPMEGGDADQQDVIVSGTRAPGPRLPNLAAMLAERPRFPPKTFADPGVHTGNVSKKIIRDTPPSASIEYRPVREGRDIAAFFCGEARKWLWTTPKLAAGEYCTIRSEDRYTGVPILIRQTADRPIAARHRAPTYFRNSLLACSGIGGLPETVAVAFLNSALYALLHRAGAQDANQKAFPQVKIRHLHALPAIPLEAMGGSFSGQPLCVALDAAAREAEEVVALGSPLPTDLLEHIERMVLSAFELPPDLAPALLESVK